MILAPVADWLAWLAWLVAVPGALAVLLALPWILRKHKLECEKLKLEIGQLEKSHTRIVSALVDTAGFRNVNCEVEVKVRRDGKIEIRRRYHILVHSGSLETLDYGIWVFGENVLEAYRRHVGGRAGGSAISVRELQSAAGSVRYEVRFDPPLSGEAHIEIDEEVFNAIGLTREQVLSQIAADKWPVTEPYEAHTYLCRHPTDRCTLLAVFPDDYHVTGTAFWDVMIGYTGRRDVQEYSDLAHAGRLKFSDETTPLGERRLRLEIERPKLGLSYWLKWIPPRAADCSIPWQRSVHGHLMPE